MFEFNPFIYGGVALVFVLIVFFVFRDPGDKDEKKIKMYNEEFFRVLDWMVQMDVIDVWEYDKLMEKAIPYLRRKRNV